MLKISDYWEYTLEEIEAEPDNSIKHQVIALRQEALLSLATNRVYKKMIQEHYQDSLDVIKKTIEKMSMELTSYSLFPGNEVIVYPRIQDRVASKKLICDISGAIINKGSYYISYQAFIDNLTSNRRYVLSREWVTEGGMNDFFPTDIQELDALDTALRNSFETRNTNKYDYYDISTRIGDCVSLRLLGPTNIERNKVKKKIRSR